MEETISDLSQTLVISLYGPAVVLLLFGVSGHVSLRYLRRLPDFPEKPALIRGAKLCGVALASVFLLNLVVTWLTVRAGMVASGAILGMATMFGGMAVLFARDRVEWEGFNFWRWPRKFGEQEAVNEWRRMRQRTQRQRRWLPYLGLAHWVAVAALLSFAAWSYWHMDRWLIASCAEERFVKMLQHELGDPQVQEVVPMSTDYEGPLFPMCLHVPGTMSKAEAERAVDQMRQQLMKHGEKRAWRIYARPEHGHTLARTVYVPPGVVLPPGTENQRPQPRHW